MPAVLEATRKLTAQVLKPDTPPLRTQRPGRTGGATGADRQCGRVVGQPDRRAECVPGTGSADRRGPGTRADHRDRRRRARHSYARFHNLRTARIGNGAKEFVALTNAAAGRTVAGAKVSGRGDDLRLAIDYQAPVAGAYPIVLVTYEVVCGRRAPALLKSFLTYTSSLAGQTAVTRLGYAPLPEDVRERVTTVIAGLTVR